MSESGDGVATETKHGGRGLGASYYKLFTGTIISNVGDGVSTVAYPWLASAITRNPVLISLIVVAQRLPWLVFTLPAGVITDRVDRRRLMVAMDVARGVLTTVVAVAVLGQQHVLPGPDELTNVVGTNTALYLVVVVATLLLGMAEVLRDNANQTILPNIVRADQLETANGRIWSIEGIANQFIGPPLGSVLLLVAFSAPFFFDGGSFFAAAAMVALIPGNFRAPKQAAGPDAAEDSSSFWGELVEGVRWLMGHPLLRPMAIILGFLNMAGMVSGGIFVLFAQDVVGVGPVMFAVMMSGGAVGGLLGGNVASWVSRRLGSGTALAVALAGMAIGPLVVALAPTWPVVFVVFFSEALFGIIWNVITVSLRQSIIPPFLLGRVNSVYRFFAWGMMPIGAALGGITVRLVELFASREIALRSTFVVQAMIIAVLFVAARHYLTTAKMDAARTAGDGAAGVGAESPAV